MRRILGTALAFSALLAFASGCGHYRHSYGYGHHHHHHHSSGSEGIALFAGVVLGAALASSAEEPPREQPPQVITQTVIVNNGSGAPPVVPVTPLPPPARDRVQTNDDATRSFDLPSARAALSAVDLSACRGLGVQGYGHAQVTFNPDGAISMVVVDEPAGLTSEGAKCVGDKLGTARVAPFRGSLVTMGATWHVR
jgi:hypothetical protein